MVSSTCLTVFALEAKNARKNSSTYKTTNEKCCRTFPEARFTFAARLYLRVEGLHFDLYANFSELVSVSFFGQELRPCWSVFAKSCLGVEMFPDSNAEANDPPARFIANRSDWASSSGCLLERGGKEKYDDE